MTDPTEDRLTRQLDTWMGAAIRFFVLANAGGAVATLSFLGTSMAGGAAFKFAVLPLACFVAGVIVARFAILRQLTAAWDAWVRHGVPPGAKPTKASLATRLGAWVEPQTGKFLLAAFGFFAAGAALGIAALLSFSPNLMPVTTGPTKP